MLVEKIKNKIFSRAFFQRTRGAFLRQLGFLLLIIFLFLASYCFYLWYIFAVAPHWNEAKKNAYIKDHDMEVTFDIEKFKNSIAKKQSREGEYQKIFDNIPDIFHLK